MSDLDSIKCPVCLIPFGAEKHIPKIFPTCGHTVCQDCLAQILEMNLPQCPLDKILFNINFQRVVDFPTNFLGKDLLEIEGRWDFCKSHQQHKKMICLTDHSLVCGRCVIFGDHKGHNVKKLSIIEETFNQKKSQLSALAERISQVPDNLLNILEERKENMKKMIKDRFKALHLEIAKQELSMLLELENRLSSFGETRFSGISEDLLPFDIQAKLKEFDNIITNPNITKLLEEDFSSLEELFEEKFVIFKAKHIEGISQILAVFQNSLPQKDSLKPLFQELHAKEIPYQEITLPTRKLEYLKNSEHEFSMTLAKHCKTRKSYRLSRAELDQIQKITYNFKLGQQNTIDEIVLSTVALLSRSLKNLVKSVSITLDAPLALDDSCEAQFYHLISAVFPHLGEENLEEINLSVENVPIGDLGLVYCAENFLSRFKNLKSFSFVFERTKTTSQTVKALSKLDFSVIYQNLEIFKIYFKNCLFDEEGDAIIEFLRKIPNVKDLTLDFRENMLSDRAFDSFSVNILPLLDKIETLELGLWETNITDKCARSLLKNIPNVKSLCVNLHSTKITDKGVAHFVYNKLKTLTNLQKLGLNFQWCNVSQNLLEKISQWERKFNEEEKDNDDDSLIDFRELWC